MERGDELMELNRRELELNRAAAQRNTLAFERVMAALDRHERLFEESRGDRDDLKVFIREINLRAEKRAEEWAQRSDELSAEQRARTDALVAKMNRVGEEVRAESKATREALVALIDRLPPPAQAA